MIYILVPSWLCALMTLIWPVGCFRSSRCWLDVSWAVILHKRYMTRARLRTEEATRSAEQLMGVEDWDRCLWPKQVTENVPIYCTNLSVHPWPSHLLQANAFPAKACNAINWKRGAAVKGSLHAQPPPACRNAGFWNVSCPPAPILQCLQEGGQSWKFMLVKFK